MVHLQGFDDGILHCDRDLVEADSRLDSMAAVIVADSGRTLETWT
jgi:hypothetical protein